MVLSKIAVFVLASLALHAGTYASDEPKHADSMAIKKHTENIGADRSALGREPMIVELTNGSLLVAGYGSSDPNDTPRLWQSSNGGSTWRRVDVGKPTDGAIGNSDVDLAVAPKGTIYFVSMGYKWPPNPEGTHIAVGVSRDEGKTWKWTVLTRERKVDRPWVVVAPDGKAYVIWNDGRSVFCAKSNDEGATWTTGTVTDAGGGSSHLAVGPKGELAVRLTPVSQSGEGFTPGADLIAISVDGGVSWQNHVAPGERDWVPMDKAGPKDTPRWVEPLVWDAKGDLYSLWTNKKAVWLARSRDLGETWKTWKTADCTAMCFFPYLAAKGDEVAATWMTGDEKKMSFYVARVTMGEVEAAQVITSAPLELDVWQKSDKPGSQPEADGGGEYDAVMFLRNGDLAVVTPVQDGEKKRFGFSYFEFGKK